MTKKRLYDVIDKAEPRGQSVTYEGIPCTARTCVTRLNRLTEENEQLKQEVREYIKALNKTLEEKEELRKENEQLKKRVEYLERKIQRERNATTKQHLKWSDEAETKIKELTEENEQLRKENKELEKFRYSVFQKMEELNK